MKISIVVPVYNAEQYLDECIESVINQTNANWELILVDDGSTDGSAVICDKYSNNYKKKIFSYHKKNEGQFLTRVYGINHCTGDYIGFLDADDVLDKAYVEKVNECIETNDKCDVIFFGFYETENLQGKLFNFLPVYKIQTYESSSELQVIQEQIVNGNISGSMWAKVFKASLIKQSLMDTSVVCGKRYAEDAYQSFNIIADAKKITVMNYPLYHYRVNPTGASVGYEMRSLDYFNTKYVFEMIREKYPICKAKEYEEKLVARNFNETIYHILKFYRSAQSSSRRKEIVSYDWSQYLLKSNETNIYDNKYVRKSYIKVWNAFRKKKYLEIFVREKYKRIIGW